MAMQDVSGATKKYWPYVLGGVIGLYVVYKYVGGNSNSGAQYSLSGSVAFDPAQAQVALASQSMNLQAARDEKELQVAYMKAQSEAALNVGVGAAQLVSALQKPTIAAINAAGAENAATVMSAAALTSASYAARGQIASAALLASGIQTQAIASGVGHVASTVNAASAAAGSAVGAAGAASGAGAAADASSDSAMWSALGTIAVAYFSGGTVWV